MALIFKEGRPVVRLRAFRAIDDPKTCERFIEGHAHVLTAIGVKKVTSSKNDWMYNPAAFVLIVESLDGENVYGGARIHVSGGSQPLPIEEATGNMDAKIFDLVWDYAQEGTGEGCGLWNSREIAGYGIGSIFLTRAAIAIAPQIGIKSLFALCAPYTINLTKCVGYRLESGVGNNGTFYYPKLDLLATTMILDDVNNLELASEEDRKAILELRNRGNVVRIEELRSKEIEIHYMLQLDNMDKWNLTEVIKQMTKQNTNAEFFDENNLNIL
ncbi:MULTISPECIES: hypothetical protein [Sphingobacterium]|uniref:N-acetyltransferase domain-containing protein n=1 Tax=Sphingobacterium kitahiroshimense TaxID=470446 RepID=A0ABV0BN85_9SPHI|nr:MULTISPECIES: hypothetical protein [Sphingobacterium]MCS3553858.1 hypothetical protein [Sphingobacterium sp. JUb21]MCW2260592.1 hypothetical protein [Sphingobacterium kitahiroshimense]TCR05177.1 hypothetical protein EDF66_10771 [Sphingobacterium sp. JUb20]TCR08893.1 hypothetical protein EDF67_10648 [Sphingobacterium sp. JUb78]